MQAISQAHILAFVSLAFASLMARTDVFVCVMLKPRP